MKKIKEYYKNILHPIQPTNGSSNAIRMRRSVKYLWICWHCYVLPPTFRKSRLLLLALVLANCPIAVLLKRICC